MTFTQIRNYLDAISPGKLSDDQRGEVDSLLSGCWDDLKGSKDGGMATYKLNGRVENVEWAPPILSFNIVRHGGTVLGSSRGEIQQWNIDLNRGTAACETIGHKQIHPSAKPLDVKSIANEIAALITDGRKDERLTWRGTNWVKIAVGEIIPETNKQTTSRQRRRFWEALERILKSSGWNRKSSLVFEHFDADHQPNESAS